MLLCFYLLLFANILHCLLERIYFLHKHIGYDCLYKRFCNPLGLTNSKNIMNEDIEQVQEDDS